MFNVLESSKYMYLNSSWIIDLNKSVRYWDLLHDI